MDCCWKKNHCKRLHFRALFCFCLCLCLIVHGIYTTNCCPESHHSEASLMLSGGGGSFFQKQENGVGGRRVLGGLGSSPPRCTSKCGGCSPCRPVHVPVPPGTPVTMEYYPEAWRCKCGNKLFMP